MVTTAPVHADARASCFYARRALELAVHWVFKHDAALKLPYQDNISALIHEPTFKQAAGEAVFNKARVINTLGNRAVHGPRAVPVEDAVAAVRDSFTSVIGSRIRTREDRGRRQLSRLMRPRCQSLKTQGGRSFSSGRQRNNSRHSKPNFGAATRNWRRSLPTKRRSMKN